MWMKQSTKDQLWVEPWSRNSLEGLILVQDDMDDDDDDDDDNDDDDDDNDEIKIPLI
jgi:hypothetical protein